MRLLASYYKELVQMSQKNNIDLFYVDLRPGDLFISRGGGDPMTACVLGLFETHIVIISVEDGIAERREINYAHDQCFEKLWWRRAGRRY